MICMKLNLSSEERRVLMYFQAEGTSLLASQVAAYLKMPEYLVLKAMESLAERELIHLEDGGGWVSVLGNTYNLLADESLEEVIEAVTSPTRIILRYFLDDPESFLSAKRLEIDDGLSPGEIYAAIEECERVGYPLRTRVRE